MLLFLIVCLALLIGAIALQIVLSRMENPVFGLLLPVLYLVGFVVAVLYTTGAPNPQAVFSVFLPLLASNFFIDLAMVLPVALLLFLYFVCRRKYRRQSQMDRMRIQDL